MGLRGFEPKPIDVAVKLGTATEQLAGLFYGADRLREHLLQVPSLCQGAVGQDHAHGTEHGMGRQLQDVLHLAVCEERVDPLPIRCCR